MAFSFPVPDLLWLQELGTFHFPLAIDGARLHSEENWLGKIHGTSFKTEWYNPASGCILAERFYCTPFISFCAPWLNPTYNFFFYFSPPVNCWRKKNFHWISILIYQVKERQKFSILIIYFTKYNILSIFCNFNSFYFFFSSLVNFSIPVIHNLLLLFSVFIVITNE